MGIMKILEWRIKRVGGQNNKKIYNFLFEVSPRQIRKFCIIFFSPDFDLTYGSHFFSDTEENYIQTKKIFHPLVVLSILSVSAQEIIRNSFLFKLLYQLDSLWNINRNQDMERVNGHRNHPRNRLRDQPMCFFPFIEM